VAEKSSSQCRIFPVPYRFWSVIAEQALPGAAGSSRARSFATQGVQPEGTLQPVLEAILTSGKGPVALTLAQVIRARFVLNPDGRSWALQVVF
jgi:hypothetical protein